IREVTLYPRQALVKRAASLDLPAGQHHLVLGALPQDTVRESVQVGGQGAFSLRDINVVEVPREPVSGDHLAALGIAIEELTQQIQELDDQRQRLEREREYLDKIGDKMLEKREKEAATLEMNPDNWLRIGQFLHQRGTELDRALRETERKKTRLEQQKSLREQEQANLGGEQGPHHPRVEVTVDVKRAGTVRFEVTYLVPGAGWGPRYELRVASGERSMELRYQAQVWQNSGENWNGVRLFLSTASPHRASQHPDLSPWRVDFLAPPPPVRPAAAPAGAMSQQFSTQAMENVMISAPTAKMAAEEAAEPPLPEMEQDQAEVTRGATAEFYEVAGKTSIASDNQLHQVGVMTRSFPVHLRYSTVPKLSAVAYLKAKAQNDSGYTLLPGPATVFLDQNFVTTARLSRVAQGQEFWTFLGPDEDLAVEYKPLKKTTGDKGFLSKKNTLLCESRIVLTNRKQAGV
ncbi:MAG TPA: mucoidy inhibitor MuiA family protein, partial [Candidatus Aminicenantes bacterium]|nr:mucoidy inhibitor MuiA family protein [Candidatus Aminicenantes bacterium]